MTNTARTAVDCMATLAAAIHERVGWWGTPQLVRLQRMLGDSGRSERERVFHRVLRAAGVSGWRANVVLREAARRP